MSQGGGVSYPFAPFGKPGSLGKTIVGKRVFDFNFDGLAHVGMVPDLIEDLRSLGLSAELIPLFNSAEAYIRLWEKAEQKNILPPDLAFTVAPGPNLAGWNRADVTVTGIATENSTGDGWPIQTILYSASGAQPIGTTTVSGTTFSVGLTTEGTTTFSGTATDEAGNISAVATRAVNVDKTPPAVSCDTADGLWHGTDVGIACTASDAPSGLSHSADAAFTLTTSVPAGTETANAVTGNRDVIDAAGNTTTAGPIAGNKIDKKAPSIAIASPTASVYVLNQAVAASYSCADGGSSVTSCAGPVPSGTNFMTSAAGSHSFIVSAADHVQNASSAAVTYVIAYNVCLLYDPGKARPAGSTVPIRLQLCDVAGANASSSQVVVTATGLTQVSTNAPGTLEDSGSANPDSNFRFDEALSEYVFNLKTTGFATGTYRLAFTAAGDPTEHSVEFQVK